MSVDVEMERVVLAQAMKSPEYLDRAIPIVRDYAFSQRPHTWIWGTLTDVWRSSRELPSAAIYATRIARDWPDETDDSGRVTKSHEALRDNMKSALVELWRKRPDAPKAALREIRDFVEMAAIRNGLYKAAEGLDEGDTEAAKAQMRQALAESRSFDSLSEPTPLTDWNPRLARYTGQIPAGFRFRTFSETLNRYLGGGLEVGSIAVMSALTGSGKTTAGVALGAAALISPHTIVGHIVTEEPKVTLETRYDAHFAKIDKARLLLGALDAEEVSIYTHAMSLYAHRLSRVFCEKMPGGTPIETAFAFFMDLRRKFPGQPLMGIIDMPDDFAPPRMEKDIRQKTIALYQTIEAWPDPKGELYPFAGWNMTQASQKYEGKKLGRYSGGESVIKGQKAAVFIGLEEQIAATPDNPVASMILRGSKNRQGPISNFAIYTAVQHGIADFDEAGYEGERDPGDED